MQARSAGLGVLIAFILAAVFEFGLHSQSVSLGGSGYQPGQHTTPQVRTGSGAPSPFLGNVGDVYFDTTNIAFYGPLTVYGWGAGTNLKGTGGSPNFSDEETPSGAIDGSNVTFALAYAPNPAASLALFWNGIYMTQGTDYTLSVQTITTTFTHGPPNPGDVLTANYRH